MIFLSNVFVNPVLIFNSQASQIVYQKVSGFKIAKSKPPCDQNIITDTSYLIYCFQADKVRLKEGKSEFGIKFQATFAQQLFKGSCKMATLTMDKGHRSVNSLSLFVFG